MCRKQAIPFLMTLCIGTAAWGLEASMKIMPATLEAPPSSLVNVDALVSSPEQIAAVTFTVEYNSAGATFVSATKGNGVPPSWSIDVYQNVGNEIPGMDRSVYVQLIGSGVNWFTGTDKQVAVLRFQLASTDCKQTALSFTTHCDYTYLSTLQLITICGPSLLNGRLNTPCASDAPSPRGALRELRNVPNPFNPSTTILFEVASGGLVQLRVFDISGRMVRHLLDADMPSGRHEVHWNGRDDAGKTLPGGVYLYQLATQGETFARRTVLLK